MAKLTGKDLNLVLGGTVVKVMRGWEVEDSSVNVDTTAAGDPVMDRAPIRGDWRLTWNALINVEIPYIIPSNITNTVVAFSAEVVAADANGLAASTGLV